MLRRRRIGDDQRFFSSDLSRFLNIACYLLCMGVVLFGLFVMLAMFRISSFAFGTYDDASEIPYHRVGLLLGTSPMQAPGVPNGYFTSRIEAAASLYRSGKIDYILASGDNRERSYNEPREMRKALIKAGVPAERIVLDYAGIRTLDSVLRASSVFMLRDLTVISQSFHNERALFIAGSAGIRADAFNAKEPDDLWAKAKVRVREFFARLKCVLDVYLLDTGPHFYGDPVQIGNIPLPVQLSNKPRHLSSLPRTRTDAAAVLKEKRLEDEKRQAQLAQIAAQEQRAAAAREAQQAQMNPDQESCDLSDSADCEALRQSEALSAAAQDQAQQEAASAAAGSLNEGESTYIDPDAAAQGDTQEPPRRQNNRRVRQGVTPHGDPWDYY